MNDSGFYFIDTLDNVVRDLYDFTSTVQSRNYKSPYSGPYNLGNFSGQFDNEISFKMDVTNPSNREYIINSMQNQYKRDFIFHNINNLKISFQASGCYITEVVSTKDSYDDFVEVTAMADYIVYDDEFTSAYFKRVNRDNKIESLIGKEK